MHILPAAPHGTTDQMSPNHAAVPFAAMAEDGRGGPGTASSLARAVGYGMVGVVVGLVVRAWRAAVVISDDSVVVRGLLVSRRFPLTDVDRFALHESGPIGNRPCGELVFRSGGHRWLWHIAPPNPVFFPNNTATEQLIRRMNADLASRRPRSSRSAATRSDP